MLIYRDFTLKSIINNVYNTKHTSKHRLAFPCFPPKHRFQQIDFHSSQRFPLIWWPAFSGPKILVYYMKWVCGCGSGPHIFYSLSFWGDMPNTQTWCMVSSPFGMSEEKQLHYPLFFSLPPPPKTNVKNVFWPPLASPDNFWANKLRNQRKKIRPIRLH